MSIGSIDSNFIEKERANSNTSHELNETGFSKYTQLKNFVGLSSPGSHTKGNDELHSNKGSIISSLSSYSHDASPIPADDMGRSRSSSRDAAEETNYVESTGEFVTPNSNLGTLTKEKEQIIFNKLFGNESKLKVPNNNLDLMTSDNAYYPEKVKVTSALPSKSTAFKDKTRLVQTLRMHQGAIWTMKFSPSGLYLCTAGQDTNVIVWNVGAPTNSRPPSSTSFNNKQQYSESDNSDNYSMSEDSTNIYDHKNNGNLNNVTNTNNRTMGTAVEMEMHHAPLKPFINPQPYRIFEGHTGDIIDVAWSKSDFILSASTDKTVCLWHVTKADCLQYFRHPDIVTAVEFHPAHDRYYISGCFDRKLRVWDIIPDGVVQEWTQTTDTITSICFSPDGKTVASGLIQGKVYFYDLIGFDQLKYRTQMDCRNRGGKYSRGTKVTGMCYRPSQPSATSAMQQSGGISAVSTTTSAAGGGAGAVSGQGKIRHNSGSSSNSSSDGNNSCGDMSAAAAAAINMNNDGGAGDSNSIVSCGDGNGNYSHKTINSQGGGSGSSGSGGRNNSNKSAQQQHPQLLVSTNDCRIRLCRLDDYSLVCKYKGLRNKSMQIKASFSSDGRYVICGSENGAVVVWRTKKPARRASAAMMLRSMLFLGGGGGRSALRSNRNTGYESIDSSGSYSSNSDGSNSNNNGATNSSMNANNNTDIATTVALFAPVDSVKLHIHNNQHIIGEKSYNTKIGNINENNNSTIDDCFDDTTGRENNYKGNYTSYFRQQQQQQQQQPSLPNAGNQRHNNKSSFNKTAAVASDYSSRAIVAADYEGNIRVFFRLS